MLTEDEIAGLGIALNEAPWPGLSIDTTGRRAATTLAVLALDLVIDDTACSFSLDLSHDLDPYLQVRLWFEEFRLFTPVREEIALQKFIADGKRWWDALYSGDERTSGFGIVPLKRESGNPDRPGPAPRVLSQEPCMSLASEALNSARVDGQLGFRRPAVVKPLGSSDAHNLVMPDELCARLQLKVVLQQRPRPLILQPRRLPRSCGSPAPR